jgi:hypothetical protein
MTSANKHDINAVTDVIDNIVIKRPGPSLSYTTKGRRKQYQHLCLDRAYNFKTVEQQIIKRGYFPHIPYKRKREEKKVDKYKASIKRYPARRC